MTILAFIIIGALIALGTLPQAIGTLGMAIFWALDAHPSIYAMGAMWVALWLANAPGLSLSAINGNSGPVSDWEKKFKPSGWVLRKLAIRDQFIAGSVGTAIRYSLFIPAIILGNLWQLSINYPKLVITCVMFCVLVGFVHWLAGHMLRHTKYAGYATVVAEGLSAGLIGWALIV